METTTTSESTVSFDNSRWSIGFAREVEWVRLNREDNLAVLRAEDGSEFTRGVSDIVMPFREGTVVSGKRWNEGPVVLAVVTNRQHSGFSLWTADGAEFIPWSSANDWSYVTSPALGSLVDALWKHYQLRIGVLIEAGNRERQEHETWKERAIVTAHEYADRHDLCGEFDRCMEEIGLRGRERDFNVDVEVTLPITVRVTATSADSATQMVDESDVEAAVLGLERYDINIGNYDVGDAEPA